MKFFLKSPGQDLMEELFLAKWRPYAWIILIGLILYCKTLFFNYTYLDDKDLILDNYAFLKELPNVIHAFQQSVYIKNNLVPYYRPLLLVSFILDAQIGGLEPFIYHLTNILLHLAVSTLLFFLLIKIGYRRGLSFFFSLIFVIHPMCTQAVAWIPGRNDTLAALFTILAFIAFLNFLDKKKSGSFIIHMLCLAAAVFTKESSVILMPIFISYIIFIKKERWLSPNVKILSFGYAVLLTVWFIMRKAALHSAIDINSYEAVRFIILQLPSIVQLIGKALFPLNLSVLPTMNNTTFIYGAIAVILITSGVFRSKSKRPNFVFFGLAWMILFLLPPMIRPHAAIVGDVLEHRFYIPMIGLIFILMEIDYVNNFSRRAAAPVAGLAIISVFFMISAVHIENFKNKVTFWENAVAGSPNSAFTRMSLAMIYYGDERMNEAERQIQELRKISPMLGHYYIGTIYMKRGRVREAEKAFRKHIALYPNNDLSYLSLGVLYYNTGKTEEAVWLWKRALELNPDNITALKNLAIYYFERNDIERARFYANELRNRGASPPADFIRAIDGSE